MSVSGCDCCRGGTGSPCAALSTPYTLLTWRGSHTIENDLRTLPLWQARNLDRYLHNNLMWQVVVLGTGDIAENRLLCYYQDLKAAESWTAPKSDAEFRNYFDPVNIGTTWQGRLRSAYGSSNSQKRGVIVQQHQGIVDPDGSFKLFFEDGTTTTETDYLPNVIPAISLQEALESLANVGVGNVSVTSPAGCEYDVYCGFIIEMIGALANTTFPAGDLGWSVDEASGLAITILDVGSATSNYKIRLAPYAVCNNGLQSSPNITVELDEEGRLQCTSESPFELEFALQIRCLGCYYAEEFSMWDLYEDVLLSRNSGVDPPTHRAFYLLRRFGPDGFDGHLRNEAFTVNGITEPRKPPCRPEIVYFGDGAVENILYPRSLAGGDPDYPASRHTLNPVGDLDRLKTIYGTKFSYWGPWLDSASGTGTLSTTFDRFDFTDAEVIWLGGMNAYRPGERFNEGLGASAQPWPFAAGALDALKAWLDRGEKLLILDGGWFPDQFCEALGLATRVEPEGDPADELINNLQLEPLYEFQVAGFPHVVIQGIEHPFTMEAAETFGREVIAEIVRPSHKAGISGILTPRIYTTSIRRITPGGDSDVIGQVYGGAVLNEVPYDEINFLLNYVGMVVEKWASNPTSRVVISKVNEAFDRDELGNNPDGPPLPGNPDRPDEHIIGRGLSACADEQFLRNLWDRRHDF